MLYWIHAGLKPQSQQSVKHLTPSSRWGELISSHIMPFLLAKCIFGLIEFSLVSPNLFLHHVLSGLGSFN